MVEESRDKSVKDNFQENDFVSSSEGYPNRSVDGSNILRIESKIPEGDESEVNLVNKNHHVDRCGRKEDMEKALEHQAQLIDRFGAMEKAQREWEEKFRENNNSTTPVCFSYSKCFFLKSVDDWLLHEWQEFSHDLKFYHFSLVTDMNTIFLYAFYIK